MDAATTRFSAAGGSLLKCRKFPVLREFRPVRRALLLFAAFRRRIEEHQWLGPDLFRLRAREGNERRQPIAAGREGRSVMEKRFGVVSSGGYCRPIQLRFDPW